MSNTTKEPTFIQILNNPESRRLVDLIEEDAGTTNPVLIEMQEEYKSELKANFNYSWED